jgi:hypothetical protein
VLVEASTIGAVGSGAATVLGATGGAAAGAIAKTLGVAAAINRIASGGGNCAGQDPSQEPSLTDSPLRLTLGTPVDYVAGTAVGAPIMCVVVAVGCGGVTWLATQMIRFAAARGDADGAEGRDSDGGDAPLRRAAEATVAGFLLGANILGTPAVTAAIIRWHQGDAGPTRNAAAACAAVLAVSLIGCAVAAVAFHRSGQVIYLAKRARNAASQPSRIVPPWPKRFKRWLFRADGEWATRVELRSDDAVAERATAQSSTSELVELGLLPVMDELRGPRAWFCVVDAAVQVGLGVAGAAAEFTAADSGLVSCAATAWATCAVSGIYVAVVLAARPHRYRAQWLAVAVPNVIAFGLALATAGVVQYAVMLRTLPDRDVLIGLGVGAQGLSFIQALYDLTVQAQDLVAAWRARTLWRYLRRKTHSTAAHARGLQKATRDARHPVARSSGPALHKRFESPLIQSCSDVELPVLLAIAVPEPKHPLGPSESPDCAPQRALEPDPVVAVNLPPSHEQVAARAPPAVAAATNDDENFNSDLDLSLSGSDYSSLDPLDDDFAADNYERLRNLLL